MEAATAPRGAAATQDGLKRAISRNMLLLFVVGDVLGAGIYALVGTIGDRVGGRSGRRSCSRSSSRSSSSSRRSTRAGSARA